jgi:hypothetical protein
VHLASTERVRFRDGDGANDRGEDEVAKSPDNSEAYTKAEKQTYYTNADKQTYYTKADKQTYYTKADKQAYHTKADKQACTPFSCVLFNSLFVSLT